MVHFATLPNPESHCILRIEVPCAWNKTANHACMARECEELSEVKTTMAVLLDAARARSRASGACAALTYLVLRDQNSAR
jgi:hypothetical protein